MKRIIRIIIICAFLLTGIGIAPGLADPDASDPIYLPMIFTGPPIFSISGTIKDTDNYPVAGAVVKDIHGVTATTGLDGSYTMEVQKGPNTLSASRSGYSIDPQSLNVTSNLTGVNFQAQVGCGSVMVNEQVTTGMGGWEFLTDQEDDVVPGTDGVVFQSAPSSGRVGINPGVDNNVASTTKARSQVYHIPSDADLVFVGVYVNRVDSGAGEIDRQFIDLLDKNNNTLAILNGPVFDTTAAWTYLEFPLDAYIGQDIKIQFRVVNDGGASSSTMYFDDVSLVMCNTHCDSQVVNSGFETRDGWLYNAEAVINPWYVGPLTIPLVPPLTINPHGGAFMMQTGIPPLGVTNVGGTFYFNVESSSEVWQRNIDLPGDQSGALLTFWIYRTSVEGVAPPGVIAKGADPTTYRSAIADPTGNISTFANATPPEDWVYVYVYDDAGHFLAKPLWQRATNDATWIRYSFDLSDYMGQQIELLFGTYNDGKGGPSAMWIDDVVVGTCD